MRVRGRVLAVWGRMMARGRKPRREAELLDWAAQRLAMWAQAQGIGVDPARVAEAQAQLADAQTQAERARAARTAAEAATLDKDLAVGRLERSLAALMATIDAFAQTTGDAGVHARAGLAPARPPSPRTTAPTPTPAGARALADGRVLVRFRVRAGGGAVYPVRRSVVSLDGRLGRWREVGLADAGKRFVDAAAPTGVLAVLYSARTRLVNGTQSQWSQPATLRYGVAAASLAEPAPHAPHAPHPADRPGDRAA